MSDHEKDDFQLMDRAQLEEAIAEIEEEIESDECLKGTTDFKMVRERYEENIGKLEAAKEALSDLEN